MLAYGHVGAMLLLGLRIGQELLWTVCPLLYFMALLLRSSVPDGLRGRATQPPRTCVYILGTIRQRIAPFGDALIMACGILIQCALWRTRDQGPGTRPFSCVYDSVQVVQVVGAGACVSAGAGMPTLW